MKNAGQPGLGGPGALRDTLAEAMCAAAAERVVEVVEGVIIYLAARWRESGSVAGAAAWAINDNAAPWGGVCSSTALVAGVGFEPTTFRL
jgi:site-specific DNA recombinase